MSKPRGSGNPALARMCTIPALPGMKRITKGVRLPEWVWAWLDEQDEPRGTVLEKALLRVHKLKPPTAG